jgi:hypothetical protein
VVSPLEGDQLGAGLTLVAPPLPGDLQSHLHRRGAVIGEEHPLEAGVGAEPLRQPLSRPMAEVGEDHLLQLGGLLGDGRRDGRFPMTMERHPPAADGIDEGAAVLQLQQGPPSTLHPQGRIGRGHLGCGMPEVGMPAGVHERLP